MKSSNKLSFGFLVIGVLLSATQALAQRDANPSMSTRMGYLGIRGQETESQPFKTVKAYRCPYESTYSYYGGTEKKFNPAMRGKCKLKGYLDLNKAYPMEEGLYILGYENSVNPGFVEVTAGQQTVIDLQPIEVPNLGGAASIVVVRDLSMLVEQKKQMFQLYALGGNMVRISEYPFGAYLGTTGRNLSGLQNYSACKEFYLGSEGSIQNHAQRICAAAKSAQSLYDLAVIFEFETTRVRVGDSTPADSSVIQEQYWVSANPGDVIEFRYPRLAISSPVKPGDVVWAFPGSYAFVALDKNNKLVATSRMTTSQIYESYFGTDEIPEREPNPALSCEGTKIWRTEVRAFCTSDHQYGCDRSEYNFCESMELYLRDE